MNSFESTEYPIGSLVELRIPEGLKFDATDEFWPIGHFEENEWIFDKNINFVPIGTIGVMIYNFSQTGKIVLFENKLCCVYIDYLKTFSNEK